MSTHISSRSTLQAHREIQTGITGKINRSINNLAGTTMGDFQTVGRPRTVPTARGQYPIFLYLIRRNSITDEQGGGNH